MTEDLIAFLKARLDEDRQAALAVDRAESSWTAAVDVGDEINYAVVTSDDPAALQEASGGGLLVDNGSTLVARCGEMGFDGENYRNHIARWDPARVIAEVQAKRRMVGHLGVAMPRLSPINRWGPSGMEDLAGNMLQLLALPYAEHPDYRAEWAPDYRRDDDG